MLSLKEAIYLFFLFFMCINDTQQHIGYHIISCMMCFYPEMFNFETQRAAKGD